jgi:hypothetical protein
MGTSVLDHVSPSGVPGMSYLEFFILHHLVAFFSDFETDYATTGNMVSQKCSLVKFKWSTITVFVLTSCSTLISMFVCVVFCLHLAFKRMECHKDNF